MRLLLLLLLATSALAAPVPREAKVSTPPPFHPGNYTLVWGGSPYEAAFHPDGSFCERVPGAESFWAGQWQWDPETRLLSVAEAHNGGDYFYRWTVRLDTDLKGTNNNGTTIRLTPIIPMRMPGE